MTADVEEGAKDAVLVAHEQHGDVADSSCAEGPRLGDVRRQADVLPEPPEDPLLLEPENCGVRVPAPRECPGLGRAHEGER